MNVTNFYRELFEYTLGLDVLGLEAQFPDLVRLVETKTLTTFGQYIKARYKLMLDLQDKRNIVPKQHNTKGVEYYITDENMEKFHLPILGIDGVEYNNTTGLDPYDPDSSAINSAILASRNNLTLESVLMASEYTYNRTLTNFSIPWQRYYELRGSNVLYLENYAFDGTVEVTIKTRYPNLVSIPEEFRDEFMNLAKLDVKVFLWSQLRFLTSLTLPSGNIDLQFDWSSADQDRDEYLKQLRSRSFPDRVSRQYFLCV